MAVAFVLVQAAEMGVHHMHPFPAGMDTKDMNAIKAFVATLPVSAFILVLLGWFVGTAAGTFSASKIGRSATPGYVTGGLLFAAGIANSIIIPQPLWFTLVSFVIYIAGTLLGVRIGSVGPASAGQ
jgi:hypothetical protein